MFIRHLGRNLIILKTRNFLSGLNCIHLIPPTLLLSPTRSLCCRAEASLVSFEYAGAVKVPPDMENLREQILLLCYRVIMSNYSGSLPHLQLPGKSRSIGRNCIGVFTHIYKAKVIRNLTLSFIVLASPACSCSRCGSPCSLTCFPC